MCLLLIRAHQSWSCPLSRAYRTEAGSEQGGHRDPALPALHHGNRYSMYDFYTRVLILGSWGERED